MHLCDAPCPPAPLREGRTMIRKDHVIAVFATLALSILPGCANKAESNNTSEGTSSDLSSEETGQDGKTEEDRFAFSHGSFDVANGWRKYDPQSTEAKPFFVSSDYDGNGIPDNISVEYGTNHYSKDDPISFGRAITAQLAQQVQGYATGEITANGITSDMGDPVLVFNIPTGESQITQYYICGDYEYILVYETNFSGSSECDEVAKTIVDTFTWSNQN